MSSRIKSLKELMNIGWLLYVRIATTADRMLRPGPDSFKPLGPTEDRGVVSSSLEELRSSLAKEYVRRFIVRHVWVYWRWRLRAIMSIDIHHSLANPVRMTRNPPENYLHLQWWNTPNDPILLSCSFLNKSKRANWRTESWVNCTYQFERNPQ